MSEGSSQARKHVRIPPDLDADVTLLADVAGMSFNSVVVEQLTRFRDEQLRDPDVQAKLAARRKQFDRLARASKGR